MLNNSSLHHRLVLALFVSITFTACGFHLRGVNEITFKNIFIQGNSLSISRELNQSFKSNGVRVVDNQIDAELLLEMLNENSEKRILSLSASGVVREYEINYRVTFRTRKPSDPIWNNPQTVQSRRNFSYNDNALLSKLDEETKLNADMHSEAIREILRRLSAIKLTAK
jgi:LPS-assembly lipoprotein